MSQIYDMPAFTTATATYTAFNPSSHSDGSGITLSRVAMYPQRGILDNKAVGIKNWVFIAQSDLTNAGITPALDDKIQINGQNYKIVSLTLRQGGDVTAIEPFFKLEIKTTK
jgi:hypothetical protein